MLGRSSQPYPRPYRALPSVIPSKASPKFSGHGQATPAAHLVTCPSDQDGLWYLQWRVRAVEGQRD